MNGPLPPLSRHPSRPAPRPPSPSPLGVVLSGGGARGAYEAGVLSYVFGELPASLGRTPTLDYVCGTSVGAVNGAFLAAVADDPVTGVAHLGALWSQIRLGDVLDFGVRQASRLYRVLTGSEKGETVGFFDARPLAALVQREVRWRRLVHNLRAGRLQALTLTTTHVATGRPTLWVDAAPGLPMPTRLPRNVEVRPGRVRVEHVLASAAIPVLFPPVAIGLDLHCDGGLRLNTPIAPAVHLGAERLLVIGMSSAIGADTPSLAPGQAPGAAFLLGKVLNAFLLDHVTTDLEELARLNALVDAGERAFGADFMTRVNGELVASGQQPRKRLRALAIRPSLDLGRLAGEHMREDRGRVRRELGTTLLRLLDLGEGADADLASYLLFDGAYAARLVELGRKDAAARRDEIADFLFGA
jgi:NTE family protein